eukprot:COSAG06_NODE_3576_length_5164_cov_2.017173_1_plen_33_part_00
MYENTQGTHIYKNTGVLATLVFGSAVPSTAYI